MLLNKDCELELPSFTLEDSSIFVNRKKRLLQQWNMSRLQIVKVSLRIWFFVLPIPNKSTTNVWRLTCQLWNNSSGTTATIVTKRSSIEKKKSRTVCKILIFASLLVLVMLVEIDFVLVKLLSMSKNVKVCSALIDNSDVPTLHRF